MYGPDVQTITSRLLRYSSASSSTTPELVRGYLQAFGIPDAALRDLPPVFKDTYAPEWKAFTREFGTRVSGDDDRNALYVVLEFMRYMKHMGINPFLKPVKPPNELREQRLDVQKVYENLLRYGMQDLVSQMLPVIRKTHLLTQLVPSAARSRLAGNGPKYELTTCYVLKPKRARENLDGVLNTLQGFLYSGHEAPQQLREAYQKIGPNSKLKAKVVTPSSSSLMGQSSHLGWLVVSKSPQYSIYVARARGSVLVLRIEIPIALDMELGSKAKALILRSWAQAFGTFK